MVPRKAIAAFVAFVLVSSFYISLWIVPSQSNSVLNPIISEIISKISESEIYNTVYDLQNFGTRVYGYPGNVAAGTYLYNRFSSIPGLNVEYQGGEFRNVIATLPGVDNDSDVIYMVGAHYDSKSSDPNNAPGATDNAGGVGIVLEFARIMSTYRFNHTLVFACWNDEEAGYVGSAHYVEYAHDSSLNIGLYVNFDSACYDPDDRFILDIMYNTKSMWVSDLMTEYNTLYGISFSLTYNVHSCNSDHIPFWQEGYTAVMTHAETHGPAHTPSDTIDKVSTLYAKKNGQLGMSVLASLAEVVDSYRTPDVNGDGIVDMKDIGICCKAYGSDPTDPRWNVNTDINKDGIIDMKDLGRIVKAFGTIL